jgi:hypothetical protein
MSHLITRLLGDLYWVISYSRWKDERYWPAFRDALLREHPDDVSEAGLLPDPSRFLTEVARNVERGAAIPRSP